MIKFKCFIIILCCCLYYCFPFNKLHHKWFNRLQQRPLKSSEKSTLLSKADDIFVCWEKGFNETCGVMDTDAKISKDIEYAVNGTLYKSSSFYYEKVFNIALAHCNLPYPSLDSLSVYSSDPRETLLFNGFSNIKQFAKRLLNCSEVKVLPYYSCYQKRLELDVCDVSDLKRKVRLTFDQTESVEQEEWWDCIDDDEWLKELRNSATK